MELNTFRGGDFVIAENSERIWIDQRLSDVIQETGNNKRVLKTTATRPGTPASRMSFAENSSDGETAV
jgi:hypothetical protein